MQEIHLLYYKDNGRVLGYDNDHGYHHRHYLGIEEKVDFNSFEDVKKRFETGGETFMTNIKSKNDKKSSLKVKTGSIEE
jgi:hypothetical protein